MYQLYCDLMSHNVHIKGNKKRALFDNGIHAIMVNGLKGICPWCYQMSGRVIQLIS